MSWGAGGALLWLLGGQAEEEGEQGRVGLPDQMPDKLWGPAHDQAAAEASEAFPELGPVMRWPGSPPVSPVFTKWSAAES